MFYLGDLSVWPAALREPVSIFALREPVSIFALREPVSVSLRQPSLRFVYTGLYYDNRLTCKFEPGHCISLPGPPCQPKELYRARDSHLAVVTIP